MKIFNATGAAEKASFHGINYIIIIKIKNSLNTTKIT